MFEGIFAYFRSEQFMPHGMCFLWDPVLLWLHVASDALIGAAYFSIPVAVAVFAIRRRDLAYRWMLGLFTVFILACGTTHFFGIWVLWNPDYAVEGLLKATTALASVATAVALWPVLPQALAVPGPRDLERRNRALQEEIAGRRAAEARLQSLNKAL
jgi:hypothetical protein